MDSALNVSRLSLGAEAPKLVDYDEKAKAQPVVQLDVSAKLKAPFKEFGNVDFTQTPEVALKILQLKEVKGDVAKIPEVLKQKLDLAKKVVKKLVITEAAARGGNISNKEIRALKELFPQVTCLAIRNFNLPENFGIAITYFRKLQELELNSIKEGSIKASEQGLTRTDLIEIMKGLKGLRSVSLINNVYVRDETLDVFFPSETLERLVVRKCQISWRGMFNVLQKCLNLRELDVSEAEDRIKIRDIKEARAQYPDIHVITDLIVPARPEKSVFLKCKDVQFAGNSFAVNKLLQNVSCSFKYLPQDLREKVQMVAPTINALQLVAIPLDGKKLLSLGCFTRLTKLECIDCIFTPQAVKLLSQFTRLQTLNLTKSGLALTSSTIAPSKAKDGMPEVQTRINLDSLTALFQLPHLVELNLSGTIIDGEMLKWISLCKKLERLNISNCPFVQDRDLWKAIESCPTLVDVNVSNNPKITVAKDILAWAKANGRKSLRITFDAPVTSAPSGSDFLSVPGPRSASHDRDEVKSKDKDRDPLTDSLSGSGTYVNAGLSGRVQEWRRTHKGAPQSLDDVVADLQKELEALNAGMADLELDLDLGSDVDSDAGSGHDLD